MSIPISHSEMAYNWNLGLWASKDFERIKNTITGYTRLKGFSPRSREVELRKL